MKGADRSPDLLNFLKALVRSSLRRWTPGDEATLALTTCIEALLNTADATGVGGVGGLEQGGTDFAAWRFAVSSRNRFGARTSGTVGRGLEEGEG